MNVNKPELLREIEEQEIFIKNIIDNIIENIPNYFNNKHNLFEVSISSNKTNPELKFNTATCVNCRIICELEQLAPYFIKKNKWEVVSDIALAVKNKFNSTINKKNKYKSILPYKSFGVLPAFSILHLARFIISNKIDDDELFGVIILRIFKILDDFNKPETIGQNFPELHPYLLHGYFKVLSDINGRKDKNLFFDSIFSTKSQIFKTRNGLLNNLFKKDDLLEIFPFKTIQTKKDINSFIVKHLNFIETFAHLKALYHIEASSNPLNADFDSSSLLYSILILHHCNNRQKYKKLILHGLSIVMNTIEKYGRWHPSLPFMVDEKARALYVTSFQIAQTTSYLLASQTNDCFDNFNDILAFSAKFNKWLSEHRVSITTPLNPTSTLMGWCSDDAPDNKRIDTWVTFHTLNYGFQQLRLLENMKKILVLNQFSHIKHEKTETTQKAWDTNHFPINCIKSAGKKNKSFDLTDIQNIICPTHTTVDGEQTAPTFIVYGPPGTSKTTLVEKISSWLGWDLLKLSPSDFITDGLEHIENKSREIFYNLLKLHKTVILFDEMDSMLRSRSFTKDKAAGTMVDFVIPALLPKIQELRDYSPNHQIAIFLLTNYFEDIDSAIRREGRFDNHLLLLPLNTKQRYFFILKYLNDKGVTLSRRTQKSIFDLLNNNFQSQLLVYRENLSLCKEILKCIKSGNFRSIKSINILPRTITSDIYDPEKNINAFNEFSILYNHILTKYMFLSDSKIRRVREKQSLNKEWNGLFEKWNQKRTP